MSKSTEYWIKATIRGETPVLMSLDASPIVGLKRILARLGRTWVKRFNELSDTLAAAFADKSQRHVNVSMKEAFKAAGFTIDFKPSAASVEGFAAVIQENVALIRSIPEQYLTQVEGDVWRAVNAGHDLGALTDTLQRRYGITRDRAVLIARDQSNKATAAMENARRRELGITQAIWQHSAAGKEPRPSHVAAAGKVFDLDKGMYLDGEWLLPGEAINCRCTSRAIIPGLE